MEDISNELEKLRSEVESCRKCPLYKGRRKAVLGEGPAPSKIMLIGEAPGYWEDQQGKPFVGAAGRLLNEFLASVGLKRDQVYITNVVKCRPPGNRDPMLEEEEACASYLEKQLSLVKASLICMLGSHATVRILTFFGLKPQPITRIHGKIFRTQSFLGEIVLIPLFHPASALYRPPMRSLQLKDWKTVGQVLAKI